jgi:hypothetical protein
MKKMVLAVVLVCMTWSLALAGAQDISSSEAKALLKRTIIYSCWMSAPHRTTIRPGSPAQS